MRFRVGLALLFAFAVGAQPAGADCTSGDCIPGGGKPDSDCYTEYFGDHLRLNSPFSDPTKKPKNKKELRCFDGDAGCDLDGEINGSCRFNVDVCVFNDSDPSTCVPPEIQTVQVTVQKAVQDETALQAAVNALLPASSAACTSGHNIDVPLKLTGKGVLRKVTSRVKLKTRGANGVTDHDTLKLRCLPHDWPSHGYNYANTRATPIETRITTANVSTLQERWTFNAGAGVSSTPTVFANFVYVSAWDGKVYAIKRKSGKQRWVFDTATGAGQPNEPPGAVPGLQSSVTVSPDGRVFFGDSNGVAYCLKGKNGKLLWKKQLGVSKSCAGDSPTDANNPGERFCQTDADCGVNGPCLGIDHFWSSPTIANERVFWGIASHSDQPCTQGQLVATSIDTGHELWRLSTVPDRVCFDDTTKECSLSDPNDFTDPNCPGSGLCVAGRGGGVTASVATDATGETVYMVSVGCLTYPSIGNSDTIFSINAADGNVNWTHRTQTIEQFNEGPAYNDYGFLNGPIVVNEPNTTAIVAAGKDGFLYARDPDTGAEVWTEIASDPNGLFAGFGLFNGAPAYADGRIYTSLNEFIDGSPLDIDHIQAWSVADGSNAWTPDIDLNPNFASLAVANGVVYLGQGAIFNPSEFYAYDAATGQRLATFTLPSETTSGPSIVDGELYIGFGVFAGSRGVRAYGLP